MQRLRKSYKWAKYIIAISMELANQSNWSSTYYFKYNDNDFLMVYSYSKWIDTEIIKQCSAIIQIQKYASFTNGFLYIV